MGNPQRKENLGNYMTGGHGALPYFNAFMNVFMKGKPRESFPSPPPIPNDIKSLIARNKREELEKLEEADVAGRKTGVTFDSGTKPTPDPAFVTADPEAGGPPDGTKPDNAKPPGDDSPNLKPVIIQPPQRRPETPAADKPETGTKRKGKKGDG